jgi:hypothetical protein
VYPGAAVPRTSIGSDAHTERPASRFAAGIVCPFHPGGAPVILETRAPGVAARHDSTFDVAATLSEYQTGLSRRRPEMVRQLAGPKALKRSENYPFQNEGVTMRGLMCRATVVAGAAAMLLGPVAGVARAAGTAAATATVQSQRSQKYKPPPRYRLTIIGTLGGSASGANGGIRIGAQWLDLPPSAETAGSTPSSGHAG